MDINERIKARRLALGLTLRDVSIALDVAESTISRYESSNIQNMGIDKIKALADVLQCTPAYLMGWEEEKPKPTGELAELLITIKNNPRLLQLCKDFLDLKPTQQDTVIALVHSMLPTSED